MVKYAEWFIVLLLAVGGPLAWKTLAEADVFPGEDEYSLHRLLSTSRAEYFADPDFAVDPWGTPIRFRDDGDIMISAGKDRKFDTADDVTMHRPY